ncbi:hypothetical protein JF550_02805 [Microbacterium esteraromaticum]|uniref:ApeA N-terminal domain-containing protein n=1 Tax=Microbacterium esteraromaticum TaxID=57043 RepID=A0A939DTU3_9MICO|nr:HEPN domain-containing protein [Microbacterium esteraromaticum]MBN8204884.1 hypothetical protein [Microbacterium esteraromaticum]MBN8415038.1 hypothetical protein [Microbacterium esteraromaticum]
MSAPRDWEFRFRCAELSFVQIVPDWIRLRRRAADACNVFFGLQYARPTYAEARLLLVAIVAEALSVGLGGTDGVSYRMRLRGLAAIPDQQAIADVVPDIEAWARDLHRARNTLAHTGNDDAERDIFELECATSSVISLVLMAELGMPADVQRRAASTVLKTPWS